MNYLNQLPYTPYHLDMIWHKPDRTNIPREEFDRRLGEITEKERWLIDGNYQRTLEIRLERCDTVFMFDIPVEICLAGAAERVGKPRDDMPWVEPELDAEFAQFIRVFPQSKLPEIYRLLEGYPNKDIIVFRSREQADNYLESLKGNLKV